MPSNSLDPLAIKPPLRLPLPHSPPHLRSHSHRRVQYKRSLAVIGTLICHGLVAAATISFAKLHHFIQDSMPLTTDFHQVGAQLLHYFESVQLACAIAAACHVATLVYALGEYLVLWCRRSPRIFTSISRIQSRRSSHTGSRSKTSSSTKIRSSWRRHYWQIDRFLTAYATEIAQARLLMEIALQAFQANKMSGLVATVWLNRLLAFVIVLNCWFTPIIYVALKKHSQYTKLVMRLSIDTVLDVIYSIGIPCVVLYPYWRDFDAALGVYPVTFYVMDAWTSVTVAELRQVFISSWTDLISKVCPWFFLCYRLHALRNLLLPLRKPERHAEPSGRWFRVLTVAQVACGFLVLGLHLHTTWLSSTTSVRGCLVEMRPWLASSYSCTVVELSCSQRGISGSRAEVEAVFTEFTLDRVQGLVVSHCPRFEMPPMIRSLTEVSMFKFYNSTICEWDHDAALTEATNPHVHQFFAIATNFSSFPDGLLSPQMPHTLRDAKFVATNLTGLPTSIAQVWSGVKYITIELSSAMHEFPLALASFPELIVVSLASNGIHSIPDHPRLQELKIWTLHMANNPISTLPESLSHTNAVIKLILQDTNVRSLPELWLATKDDPSLTYITIDAAFTPLCTNLQASGVGDTFHIGRFIVSCKDASALFPRVTYPLALETIWREANRR